MALSGLVAPDGLLSPADQHVRAVDAPGGRHVVRFLIVTLLVVVLPFDVAWHVNVVPAVSSLTAADPHPVGDRDDP